MKAFLYARVSTDRKLNSRQRRQEVENQLRQLRELAANLEYEVVREYIDRVSGTGKKTREQFDEMMEEACNRRVKAIVIWALDRFSREGPLKTMIQLDRLNSAGVRVKSLKEAWLDPDSPTYELLVPIFAWIAKQESRRIGERVRAGMEREKAKGASFGRPRHGVDPLQIAALRAQGLSLRAIAAQVGISEGSVRNALRKKDDPKAG